MNSRRDPRFALLVALIGLLFWTAVGSNVIAISKVHDFLNLYSGGLIARTGNIAKVHNWTYQKQVEDSLIANLDPHFPYMRPAFYALMLSPISLLPVDIAFPVWIGLNIAGLMLIWVWSWRRFGPDSMVYCAFFHPACMGIAYGQDCVLFALELLAVWLLLERKKDTLAGLVLALTLAKFHLFLLLPLAILLRRRWSLLRGYAAGGAFLFFLSLALVGPSGFREYLNLMLMDDLKEISSVIMFVGYKAILANLHIDFLWTNALFAVAGIALVAWSALKSEGEFRWFWTAVVGSMLVNPHTFQYDLSSLIIPGLLAACTIQDRYLRIAAGVTLIPLPYFFTVAGAPFAMLPSLVILMFFVTLSGVLPVKAPEASGARLRQQVPA